MRGWIFAVLLSAGLAPGLPAAAGEGRLFLSWHAPHGAPGASDTLIATCVDTAGVDTLFLSYEPGRDWPTLFAISAVLSFLPEEGDTLAPFWNLTRGGANDYGVRIEFCNASDPQCPGVWTTPGLNGSRFTYERTRGRLAILQAQGTADASPVEAARRYCFARLLIRRWNAERLAGCAQPICLEWSVANLTFGRGDEPPVTSGEARHASWNSPRGEACAPFRRRLVAPREPAGPAARPNPDK